MRAIVTGGAGFIGSALVHALVADGVRVTTVDKLSYAGNLESLEPVLGSVHHTFEQVDIVDHAEVARVISDSTPDVIFHLAAESHVDRSIEGPRDFVETNVLGTFTMLSEALRYWRTLSPLRRDRFRFVHVSTDEVFGSLGEGDAPFTAATRYDPSSPYSATKAAADHLARAWHRTYGLPVVVTNCSNNYGPRQFPEKLIPLLIVRALAGESLPVYGTGRNIRDWLYVDDHAEGLRLAAQHGIAGDTYVFGGRSEARNIDLVRALCSVLDDEQPRGDGRSYATQITFVADRPGHDHRYAIDPSRTEDSLGWRPRRRLRDGLRLTVRWYLENSGWWERIMSGAYRGDRLGLLSEL